MAASTPASRPRFDAALARRREAQADLVILVLCAGVILASVVLTPSDGPLSLFGWELPPLCLFKRLTGLDCLGCGLSRSFTYVGHGRLLDAFHMHKAGPFFWLLVLAQLPWRGWLLWKYRAQAADPAGDGG